MSIFQLLKNYQIIILCFLREFNNLRRLHFPCCCPKRRGRICSAAKRTASPLQRPQALQRALDKASSAATTTTATTTIGRSTTTTIGWPTNFCWRRGKGTHFARALLSRGKVSNILFAHSHTKLLKIIRKMNSLWNFISSEIFLMKIFLMNYHNFLLRQGSALLRKLSDQKGTNGSVMARPSLPIRRLRPFPSGGE
jgi:hypothetical protein